MIENNGYYHHSRHDLMAYVHEGYNRVLDIGCGAGNTGKKMKDLGKAIEVIGVELNPEVAKEAEKKIDGIIVGNIEELELPYDRYFHYIVCGDVLEHLIDPWKTLIKLSGYLADDGYLIASIPNARYWRLIRDLVCLGRWEYRESGARGSYLDVAHLRFFTKKSIMAMFSSANFIIIEIKSNIERGSRTRLINLLTLNILEDFLTFSYLIKARKKNE